MINLHTKISDEFNNIKNFSLSIPTEREDHLVKENRELK